MIKRKAYLDGEATFAQYYGDLVEELHIKNTPFGAERLRKEFDRDEHLNGIPLAKWDGWAGLLMDYQGPKIRAAFKARGDFVTQAGLVCLLKEVARRSLVEEPCRCCGHVRALHLGYSPAEPPETCRGALATCECEQYEV